MTLEFFLYEFVARVVAIYFLVDISRVLWLGLMERKTAVQNYMFMNMFWRLPDWSAERDKAPWQYWWLVSGQVFMLFVCLVMAIFGWWDPNRTSLISQAFGP